MKPIRMIWIGASCEGHITAGKSYVIVAKVRDIAMGGKAIGYSYQFVDDAGNKEWAASRLFLKAKPHYGAKKAA